ncbi:MAG: caspase family protein [Burkholderiaceae bacterium]
MFLMIFPKCAVTWTAAVHRLTIVLVVAMSYLADPVWAGPARHALVIGNANYSESRLLNPVNDAKAVSNRLREFGFRVQEVHDMKREQIGGVLERFVSAIDRGDIVVFYYSGHGLQVGGRNYLLAVDAKINSAYDIKYNAMDVGSLLEIIDDRRPSVKIVLLDACRNNPFEALTRGVLQRGLARMVSAPTGTLIGFSTRPGGVADDGSGANGLYTEHLLAHMAEPGLPIESVLKRVSRATQMASKGQQEPWFESSLLGEFSFNPGLPATQTPSAEPPKGSVDISEEAWKMAAKIDTADAYRAFVDAFPKSAYAPMAKFRLALAEARPTADVAAKASPGAIASTRPSVAASPPARATADSAPSRPARQPKANAAKVSGARVSSAVPVTEARAATARAPVSGARTGGSASALASSAPVGTLFESKGDGRFQIVYKKEAKRLRIEKFRILTDIGLYATATFSLPVDVHCGNAWANSLKIDGRGAVSGACNHRLVNLKITGSENKWVVISSAPQTATGRYEVEFSRR